MNFKLDFTFPEFHLSEMFGNKYFAYGFMGLFMACTILAVVLRGKYLPGLIYFIATCYMKASNYLTALLDYVQLIAKAQLSRQETTYNVGTANKEQNIQNSFNTYILVPDRRQRSRSNDNDNDNINQRSSPTYKKMLPRITSVKKAKKQVKPKRNDCKKAFKSITQRGNRILKKMDEMVQQSTEMRKELARQLEEADIQFRAVIEQTQRKEAAHRETAMLLNQAEEELTRMTSNHSRQHQATAQEDKKTVLIHSPNVQRILPDDPEMKTDSTASKTEVEMSGIEPTEDIMALDVPEPTAEPVTVESITTSVEQNTLERPPVVDQKVEKVSDATPKPDNDTENELTNQTTSRPAKSVTFGGVVEIHKAKKPGFFQRHEEALIRSGFFQKQTDLPAEQRSDAHQMDDYVTLLRTLVNKTKKKNQKQRDKYENRLSEEIELEMEVRQLEMSALVAAATSTLNTEPEAPAKVDNSARVGKAINRLHQIYHKDYTSSYNVLRKIAEEVYFLEQSLASMSSETGRVELADKIQQKQKALRIVTQQERDDHQEKQKALAEAKTTLLEPAVTNKEKRFFQRVKTLFRLKAKK